MTITELIPTVKKLSKTDKLLLIQMIVQEMVETETVSNQNLLKIDVDNSSETAAAETQTEEDEEDEDDFALQEIIAFLKKPLAERNRILEEQAEAMKPYYEQNTEWKEWLAGDIVEY